LLSLQGLFLELGVDISEEDVIELLRQIDLNPEALEQLQTLEKQAVPLSFGHFARTIALVLDQELADAALLEED